MVCPRTDPVCPTRTGRLRIPEEHDVNVGPQASVIRQIVTGVVGVLVDYDRIPVPKPVAAIGQVRVRHREIEAAEPESPRTAARQSEHVTRAQTRGEMAVLPGTIHMKPGIVPAGVVSHPLALVDVGSL